MSQMNVVQNAARLAMDHRAADPSRMRRHVRQIGIAGWALAAAAAIVFLIAAYALPG